MVKDMQSRPPSLVIWTHNDQQFNQKCFLLLASVLKRDSNVILEVSKGAYFVFCFCFFMSCLEPKDQDATRITLATM